MWPFIDPIECRQAEQYLAHGQPLKAARILLAAKASEHKSVRELLLRIAPQLVKQARQAFQAGDLRVARELIDCAPGNVRSCRRTHACSANASRTI